MKLLLAVAFLALASAAQVRPVVLGAPQLPLFVAQKEEIQPDKVIVVDSPDQDVDAVKFVEVAEVFDQSAPVDPVNVINYVAEAPVAEDLPDAVKIVESPADVDSVQFAELPAPEDMSIISLLPLIIPEDVMRQINEDNADTVIIVDSPVPEMNPLNFINLPEEEFHFHPVQIVDSPVQTEDFHVDPVQIVDSPVETEDFHVDPVRIVNSPVETEDFHVDPVQIVHSPVETEVDSVRIVNSPQEMETNSVPVGQPIPKEFLRRPNFKLPKYNDPYLR